MNEETKDMVMMAKAACALALDWQDEGRADLAEKCIEKAKEQLELALQSM